MRVFGGSLAAGNSIFGDDNANSSAYGANVATGNNGGYGFDGWDVINSGTGGNYIGSSTNVNLGDINVNSESWGMYGSNGGSNGCNLRRNLTGTLSVGYALSCCIAVGYRDGAKGFDGYTSSNWSSSVFNFNIAGSYIFDGTTKSSWTYSQQNIFDIIVKQTTTNNINFTVTSRVFTSETDTTNKSGVFKGFQFYCYNTNGGSENDFFANSLKVYRY